MQEKKLSFAIVTPSYVLDYERCALLAASIRRFVPAAICHYIIVERRDQALFQSLANDRTHILLQEDLVKERTLRVHKWRLSWHHPPVRGWIWQQLVKLSIAEAIDADVYVLMDSDSFVNQPWDPRQLMRGALAPFYREVDDYYRHTQENQRWDSVARRLLNLPTPKTPAATGFIVPHVFWRRDVLQKLRRHLSEGRGPWFWVNRIARSITFSEYVLYGTFVEEVLGHAASGHYPCAEDFSHSYWPDAQMNEPMIRFFRETAAPSKIMYMVNAKSKTPMPLIRAELAPWSLK